MELDTTDTGLGKRAFEEWSSTFALCDSIRRWEELADSERTAWVAAAVAVERDLAATIGRMGARIAHLEEGADRTPIEPGINRTAGQLWRALVDMSPPDRTAHLNRLQQLCQEASACFTADHEGCLTEQKAEIERLRAQVEALGGTP